MKKTVSLLTALLMILLPLSLCAADDMPGGVLPVEVLPVRMGFPGDRPVWEMDYEYPFVGDEGFAAVLINDYYDQIRTELTDLILPMLAGSEKDRPEEADRMSQRFRVTCNNGRFLSVLFMMESVVNGESLLSLESDTFDVSGEYAGQVLTLRGTVMVGESTVQLAGLLLPVLYERFRALQEEGIADPDLEKEDFEEIFYPESHFFANDDGSVTFYFQPELLREPSFDVPMFTFTPEELSSLLPAE